MVWCADAWARAWVGVDGGGGWGAKAPWSDEGGLTPLSLRTISRLDLYPSSRGAESHESLQIPYNRAVKMLH